MPLTQKGSTRFTSSYGTLQTDRFGLSTASYSIHDYNIPPTLPSIGDAHPIWTGLLVERITASWVSDHFEVEAVCVGVFGLPEPIYELDYSASEEPIETHPDFESGLAGSLGAELHGAKCQPDTGEFIGFLLGTDPKCGVRSYLSPGATWRKTTVQSSAPTSLGAVATPQDPEGPFPAAPGDRTWMYMGLTYEQRGAAFTVKQEWKLSGPRGWDTDIYGA